VRCPECGVENKAGTRRCTFCGRKLARDEAPPPGGRGWAGLVLGLVLGIAFLAGAGVLLGRRPAGREEAAVPPVAAPIEKLEAAAACEEYIRGVVPTPFRVTGFPASRVSDAEGGQVVAGTVDLQSLAGEVQRKRYWCRVRPVPDGAAPAVEGRVF
jgi:hypothetical protein